MGKRRDTSKTVLVGGVFDLLHIGHVRFLNRAKKYGDRLVVAVNTDEFVFKYKGRYPIRPTPRRVEVLRNIRSVDKVIINESNEDWLPTIKKANPAVIVTSLEWKEKDFYKQMGVSKEVLDAMGVRLVYIPHTSLVSTTKLIDRICKTYK